MTAFDPMKAAAEQLSGVEDTYKVLNIMVRDAERRAGEAEVQLNALLKARAVVANVMDGHRADLAALREAAEREGQHGNSDTDP